MELYKRVRLILGMNVLCMIMLGCGPESAEEQFALAQQYASGNGASKNEQLALKWFLASADQGYLSSQLELVRIYRDGVGIRPDLAASVQWLTLAALQGHIRSQFDLSVAYRNGSGVKADPAESLKWLGMAAEQGDPGSQVVLGYSYELGYGGIFDFEAAVHWYQKAADQKLPQALFRLGKAYDSGLGGLEEDNDKAIELFKLAEESGVEESRDAVESVLEEIEEDRLTAESLAKYREDHRILSEVVYGRVGEEITCVGLTLYVYQILPYQPTNEFDVIESGYYRIAAEIGLRNDFSRKKFMGSFQLKNSKFNLSDDTGKVWTQWGIPPSPELEDTVMLGGQIVRGWVSFEVPVTIRSGYLVFEFVFPSEPIKVRF